MALRCFRDERNRTVVPDQESRPMVLKFREVMAIAGARKAS